MKTTRESVRESNHKRIVKRLQELLQKNYDAEKDYRKAMEHADEEVLKDFCKKGMIRHNHFATQIDHFLHELNERPGGPEDHLDLQKAWTNFKTSIGKHRDDALLDECINGEKAAVKEYQHTLKKHRFPVQIEETLEKQVKEMEAVLADVKSIEDLRW